MSELLYKLHVSNQSVSMPEMHLNGIRTLISLLQYLSHFHIICFHSV